jgi:hypothetical protein
VPPTNSVLASGETTTAAAGRGTTLRATAARCPSTSAPSVTRPGASALTWPVELIVATAGALEV